MDTKTKIMSIIPNIYGVLTEDGINCIDDLLFATDEKDIQDIAFILSINIIPQTSLHQQYKMELMKMSFDVNTLGLHTETTYQQNTIPEHVTYTNTLTNDDDNDDNEHLIVSYTGDTHELEMTTNLAYLMSDDELDIFISLAPEYQDNIRQLAKEGVVITPYGIFAIPQYIGGESDISGYAYSDDDIITVCGELNYNKMIEYVLSLNDIIDTVRSNVKK